mmetsp:Transcript_34313/g.33531  ORF Transcript_34313/g.33531 Transcript_34313/m.33531 type:complete len:202 (+) Transcript_34313:158-763(+)
MKQLAGGESEQEQQRAQGINELYTVVLLICSQIFKMNLKGLEEFTHIIEGLGAKAKMQELHKVFTNSYQKRMEQMLNVYEDEQLSMTQPYVKKFPLNLALMEDNLIVSNPRIVDFEWKIFYTHSTKNLNKVYLPRFLITMVVLTSGAGFVSGGALEEQEWTSKKDYLKLKKVQFECDREELTHFHFKLKSACNSLEAFLKK